MRIFRLAFDPTYRSLKLAVPSLLYTPALQFDSTARAATWTPIDLVSADDQDSGKPEPDFWRVHGLPVSFACSAKLADDPAIEWAGGEQLAVHYSNKPFILSNATEQGCYDALDITHCEWPLGIAGVGIPSNYAFRITSSGLPRVGSPTVFTVPETCMSELYVYEYEGDPDEEFKAKVEEEGLTGLIFQEIWHEDFDALNRRR